jgi:hypothetical protein
MAMKHKLPILPVYCFGSTKLLKRVQFPEIVQKISLMFRVSLVLFFGQFGLPIPFRQVGRMTKIDSKYLQRKTQWFFQFLLSASAICHGFACLSTKSY